MSFSFRTRGDVGFPCVVMSSRYVDSLRLFTLLALLLIPWTIYVSRRIFSHDWSNSSCCDELSAFLFKKAACY